MHVARELICREDHKTRNMVVSSSTSGGGGFCYSDLSHNSNNPTIQTQPLLVSQIPNYDSNSEIFNLSQGMEMIGFPKNMQQSQNDASNSLFWKGNNFFGKPVNQHDGDGEDDHNSNSEHGPSSSKAATVTAATLNGDAVSDFYHHQGFNKSDFSSADQNLMAVTTTASHVDSSPWQENKLMVDDASIRCVFPCEGNERPSQGLSLSLSSADPSSIGLQSFELRQTTHHSHSQQGDMRLFASASASSSREGFYGKPLGSNIHQHQQPMMTQHQQGLFQLRSSKYLGPAQELLNEFCSLGTKQHDLPKPKPNKSTNMEEENNSNNNGISGSSKQQSLGSLEFMELQKRKTKLLSMLDEVDRRYRHYCDQMKAVVSSFEAVAGNGAATVYSALASKAMSRHFRCLRDGIVGQIQATKKALGEKDLASPGTTRGETPRLKIIDQALRQQRAFQQMSMMENHPWRPQRGLPERSVSVLRAWLFEHFLHPYPSDVDKHILARQTGLSRSQVSNWFINARVRLWKPMVEEMYLEETKEQDNLGSSDGAADLDDIGRSSNQSSQARVEDQKPTSDQLVRIDSECLSSIITSPEKIDHLSKMTSSSRATPQTHHLSMNHQSTSFGRIGGNSYSGMEIDFSSYNHHPAGAVPYSSSIDTNQNNFGGGIGGGGVSLTLGLQQHGGNHGVSLAFSPATQGSLFYPRDHIEDCHPSVQYSLLDGDQGQNLPYRNLMGAQLLHDLAG